MTFYSNYGSISCRFWDIQCRKYRDLEITVKRQSRSLKTVPFDRLCGFLFVFYSNFVPKTFLRYSTSNMPWPWLRIRQGHWKCHHGAHMTSYERSITTMGLFRIYSFRDRRRFPSKIAKIFHSLVFCAPGDRVPLGIAYRRRGSKN